MAWTSKRSKFQFSFKNFYLFSFYSDELTGLYILACNPFTSIILKKRTLATYVQVAFKKKKEESKNRKDSQ